MTSHHQNDNEGHADGVAIKPQQKGLLYWWQWTLTLASKSSVELVFVTHMMATNLVLVISQNLILDKVCWSKYNRTVCESLQRRETANLMEEEEQVQHVSAEIQAWRSAIEFSLPVVLVLMLGAWSDRHGRRGVMIFSLSGRVLQGLAFILNVWQWHWSADTAALCMALPVALTGSNTAFDMAAYSHIADVSDESIRTVRLGVANGFWCVGTVLGYVMSGVLYQALGFYSVFAIAVVLELVSILLVLWRVREKGHFEERHDGGGFVREFLDPRNIVRPFKTTFKKRGGNARLHICLMLFSVFVSFGAVSGRQAVLYLYTRFRFNWNEVDYGIYGMFLMMMEVVGTFFAMIVFSYKLKLHDAIVGIMSCVSQVLSSTFYIFTYTSWSMYVAPLVEIANGQVVVIPRAIITKLVDPLEQGRINAMFGCLETVIPLIFEPLYNEIYANTLTSFLGAFFLVSAILTAPPIGIFLWIYCKDKARNKSENRAQEERASLRSPDS